MANKKITISKKRGLNPSMPTCFYCGRQKGEIVLCGKLKGDAEAPQSRVFDYVPCENCRKAFAKGILAVEVTEKESEGVIPIAKGLYPTGQYMVMDEDKFARTFGVDTVEDGRKAGMFLVEEGAMEIVLQERNL